MTLIDQKNNIKNYPYHWCSISIFIILFLGLIDTTYLAYSHYKNYTNFTFNSFCALSKSVNCDTVSQSPWSIFFGLPLAYWGFLAYALFLMLYLTTLRRPEESRTLWYILCLLSFNYSLAAIYFGYISIAKIKAYCLLCLASHAISLFLFFNSWIITRRFCTPPFLSGLGKGFRYIFRSRLLKSGIFVLLTLFFCLRFFIPPYWQYDAPPLPDTIPHGITEDGHPWIGAKNAEIEIHEYTDYQCFQCWKAHLYLRRMIADHPHKIKLIHHHYPMDHEFNTIIVPVPFHIGSGKMAMIAIYAASKNKFWEMNNVLYTIGRQKDPFNTRKLAEMTGFTSGELAAASRHPQIRQALLSDIRQGMKLEITATPTFVIDGKVYQGSLPDDILKKILQ